MKTYTLEIDGTPTLVFRAKDGEDAAKWTNEGIGLYWGPPQGAASVRPATISEQAAWRARSVMVDQKAEDWGEVWNDGEGYDPDSIVLNLALARGDKA